MNDSPLKNNSWQSKVARFYGAIPYGERQQNPYVKGSTGYQFYELKTSIHELSHQIWTYFEKVALRIFALVGLEQKGKQ